jgi:hypothetical protein
MPIFDSLAGGDMLSSGDLREPDTDGVDAERQAGAARAMAGLHLAESVGGAWGSMGLVTSVIGEGKNQVVVGYEFDPKLNFARHAAPEGTYTLESVPIPGSEEAL